MKNFSNKNIKSRGRLILALFFAAGSAAFGIDQTAAAPTDTLPPGFYSTPLSQPKTDPQTPPEGQKPDDQAPLEDQDDVGSLLFLPLLEKNLLLPPATGMLYGKSGLGKDIWLDSKTETIISLMKEWRIKLRNRPVADLARRLLLTHASAPSNVDPFDFMKIRLEKIYQLGDVNILERFFSSFPVLASDKRFSQLYEQKTLIRGIARGKAASEACALWKSNQRLRQQGEFSEPLQPMAQQIAALCWAFSGQAGRGLAQAESLSDSGRAPKEFFPLLATALNPNQQGRKSNWINNSAPREVNSVLWTLYKIVKKQPRYISIASIEPALLPFIAQDASLPNNWRLAAAQRAILHGLISPRFLQSFYIKNINDSAADPLMRRPVRRHRDERADPAHVRKVSNILANAPNRTAYIASLHGWARDIAFLSPKSGYRRSDGLRASLLLNNFDRMRVWLGASNVPKNISNLPPPMQSILAVLETSKRAVHRGIAPQTIESWQQRTGLLVKVIGKEFFNIDATGMPGEDDTEEGNALMNAVERKARAEIILRALAGMDNVALARSPSFLRAVIKGLSAIGLREEVWRIAIDVFLIEAWGP